jgi:hypothetical protein
MEMGLKILNFLLITYINVRLSFVLYGCRTYSLKQNTGCDRKGCCGKYLFLRRIKPYGAREGCMMRSFKSVFFTKYYVYQIKVNEFG